MRHPHGLRAAAGNQGIVLPAIGAAFEGGFFAGTISHTANGVPTHALIVAPIATGASGDGYSITTTLEWKTTDTSTAGTTSLFDGAINSANMNNASHPAAQFCENLSIGGYADWYLPALYELDIAYQNLKPTTSVNNISYGINAYSVPKRTVNRTSTVPARTSIGDFQSGGAEAFIAGGHWASSETSPTTAYLLGFADGGQNSIAKSFIAGLPRVRAFRKLTL